VRQVRAACGNSGPFIKIQLQAQSAPAQDVPLPGTNPTVNFEQLLFDMQKARQNNAIVNIGTFV
jgi:hypothetical protein